MTTYYRSQDGKTISRGYGATNDSPPTQGGGWAVISSQERPDLYPQGTPANAGTPKLTLPGMAETGNTPVSAVQPTLPATNDTGSLVGFKDNMARVMTLAEQKRNDLLKQFMIPFKGTMPASDFTSLFSDFTAQSDQSNKMILERLIPKPDTQLITETDASGRITAITIDKNTGKVVNKEDLGVIGELKEVDTSIVEVDGQKLLINSKTGQTIKNLGRGETKPSTSVVEVGGKKLLINDQTGETIKDLGTSEKGGAVSSEMILSTSKANVDSIQNIINSGGLPISVGPSTITRSQPGFFRNLIRPLGYPEQVKGIYKRLTGEQQDFIAGTEQIRSQLNLDKLIQSKAQGATFGALSDNELQVLASAGTKLGTWAIKDGDGNIVGYNVNETAFKKEMDKINNFAKLDYIIKGGDPADVNAQIMPDGTVWTTNSDGTFTQIK